MVRGYWSTLRQIGKHYVGGSEFKVVLRKSYKTERQVLLEILTFVNLNG